MTATSTGVGSLAEATARQVRDLVAAGEVSPVEIVRSFLDRIEDHAHLNAFITLDPAGALAAAEDLQARLGAGQTPGPLCAVPVSVKDQIFTAGMRTTAGSRAFRDHVPTVDSPCVERLRAAGAIIVGKTNTPEFGLSWRTANGVAPETVNPWDRTRTCGGSSGGSAVAAAANLTPVSIGLDGAGSIRLPASFCGVAGLVGSLGRVPRFGVLDGGIMASGIGPLARDVRDVALCMSVIAGPDPRDPTSVVHHDGATVDADASIEGLRLCWWDNPAATTGRHDQAIVDHVRATARRVAGGATFESTDLGIDTDRLHTAFHCISDADRYARVGQQKQVFDDPGTRGLLTDGTRARFEHGRAVSGAEYSRALSARYAAIAALHRVFADHDVVLSPTVVFPAPPLDVDDASTRPRDITTHTFLANFTGFPAATVPCGFVDDLPVGLQVMAPPGREDRVLAVCAAVQDLLGGPPTIPSRDRA